MKKFLAFTLILSALIAVHASAAVNHMTTADEISPSTWYNDDYSGEQTRDGIVRGEEFTLHQWITDYETEADLTLTWSSPVTISKAVFYDRVSETDNVVFGTITFSDGTVVEFGELDPTGLPTEITFDEITTTSAVIHIVADDMTMAVGLDEVEFYTPEGVNIALDATASATSVLPDQSDNEEHPATWYPDTYTNWYSADKAINGYAKATVPAGAEYEWASLGESNPSIEISWLDKIKVGTIVLYDRINSDDHVIGGFITFSDGSEIEFGELPNDGSPLYIDVADVETYTIDISTITEGPNPGFAEIEVFTEHFENGKPIVEENNSETLPSSEAEVVEEQPEPASEMEKEPAEEAFEPISKPVEDAKAPQTYDVSVLLGAVSLAGAEVLRFLSKKRR